MNRNPSINSIAVFSGSNFGSHEDYIEQAKKLGQAIAERGQTMVYGGTTKGLMGVVADAALAAGGEVIGVITERLRERGHLHPGLTRHEVVSGMRERKARMAELADAFVALPGGLGTLEELFEVATLTQLAEHQKALACLNVRDFFAPLRALLLHATTEGFMKIEHCDMLILEADPLKALEQIDQWQAPTVTKWIGQPGS
ncbi:TIGR00730 family Rossman fold protein [Pseudomonas abyssi]|jgi:hypothetical protein|uniref:Cytokinin riboside 5'-monophosphate phosphoribohydrolase n=1 Tax=Pseudomonas abyssi TaxID=170540 RepID=A0A2A3MF55_9PSED|nr:MULTISPECIES: TIGR00730 family Rossman fold protein [Pseudomonadaceae]MAC99063.1 TIGR00730 family Rossman fold protein [Pseudomonadales bacterium]PBK03421.1 TIGR00730 family Rossman fold protein [Pseudomonas abyssi]|tara:strand:+ start:13207 stop:13806 length:600 start_codon:yes stop_codon:yes gene_type:complete